MSKFKVGDIVTDGELILSAEVISVDGNDISIEVLDHEFSDCVGDEDWVDANDFTFKETPVATEAPVYVSKPSNSPSSLSEFSLENIFAMKMF